MRLRRMVPVPRRDERRVGRRPRRAAPASPGTALTSRARIAGMLEAVNVGNTGGGAPFCLAGVTLTNPNGSGLDIEWVPQVISRSTYMST